MGPGTGRCVTADAFTPTGPFAPAPGLRSPHAQTIFASLFRSKDVPPSRRERWDTHDGDFVDLDIYEAAPHAPHVVLLHGLEGSSRSGYVAAILRGAHARGWGATALNFRSCSGEPTVSQRYGPLVKSVFFSNPRTSV